MSLGDIIKIENYFLLLDKDNHVLMDILIFDFQVLVKIQIYVNINMLY